MSKKAASSLRSVPEEDNESLDASSLIPAKFLSYSLSSSASFSPKSDNIGWSIFKIVDRLGRLDLRCKSVDPISIGSED